MFSHAFTRKRGMPVMRPEKCELLLPRFHRIVVPALGAPYSQRALKMACRMAGGNKDAEIRLVYFIEVPRAYSLGASMPGDEALADNVLGDALRTVQEFGWQATPEVQRGRDLSETLLRYLVEKEISLLVLGARPDNVRGMPLDIARDLYDRSPCPVILDYIAGETSARPIAAEG